jgi:hypothetical protein
LASLNPPPVYIIDFGTVIGKSSNPNSGVLSLALANGELFKGKWANQKESFVNNEIPGTAASFPPQPNLAFAWDAVFGNGYYLAHILGRDTGKAILTGSQGTVLQLDFRFNHGLAFGVAIDNKGNVYKVAE